MSNSGEAAAVAVARQAMATRFEVVLYGDDPVGLRAAGEEALSEIERLEAQLSLYQESSEIARVNARAAREPVRVSVEVFRLLEQARRLSVETGGAFDMTIGPLVRCWGFMGVARETPSAEAMEEARSRVGMEHIELDDTDFTVRFTRPGVMIDPGAIGKGYAVDCAVELMREAGIASAILHGGTSTVYAIGCPPGQDGWKVAVAGPPVTAAETEQPLMGVVSLRDEALSVSAVWGRAIEGNDQVYGHVIDPRTGMPVVGSLLSAVILPSGTEADALSTALLTLGPEGLRTVAGPRAAGRWLVLHEDAGQRVVKVLGLDSGDFSAGAGPGEMGCGVPMR